jgi:hypothetical protein
MAAMTAYERVLRNRLALAVKAGRVDLAKQLTRECFELMRRNDPLPSNVLHFSKKRQDLCGRPDGPVVEKQGNVG